MIVDHVDVTPEEFAAGTGWEIKPQGACKAEMCVPLGGAFDAVAAAERLGMAVVHDEAAGLWAFGPESLGDRALASAEAPDLALPRPGRQPGAPGRLPGTEGRARRLGPLLRLPL